MPSASSLMALVACFACQAINGVTAKDAFGTTQQHEITAGPTPTVFSIAARATESFTAVSDCHNHGTDVYCMLGPSEYQVSVPAAVTATGELPATFTDCHNHGTESFCVAPNGDDVEILGLEASETGSSGEEDSGSTESSGAGQRHCHFHAGVPHCVGGDGSEEETDCSRPQVTYEKVGLRIGFLFVMLVAGLVGAAGPILLSKSLPNRFQVVFTVLKQFGTGVIISTAFVHLLTHANLSLTNKCLGEQEYESTATALLMAGLFVSFLIEYFTHRVANTLNKRGQYNDEVIGVMILEAGIIFHSVLIGITLVVAGDESLITLFVVILFHQMFEGIALGSRIAAVGHHTSAGANGFNVSNSPSLKGEETATPKDNSAVVGATTGGQGAERASTDSTVANWKPVSLLKKLLMAFAFAVTTPVGMAIGIGVLRSFNGNDPATLWAIGTLDALSAGILVWVGVVEMWAGDWMFGGELTHASPAVTAMSLVGLIAGMALMSFLGKWA